MNVELAKRAVACKGWRWMAGMRVLLDGHRAVRVSLAFPDVTQWVFVEHTGRGLTAELNTSMDVPDLDDPATRGCLLELVRVAWDDQGLRAEGTYACGEWRWRVHGGKNHGSRFAQMVVAPVYATESEALIAALEAAPEKANV